MAQRIKMRTLMSNRSIGSKRASEEATDEDEKKERKKYHIHIRCSDS